MYEPYMDFTGIDKWIEIELYMYMYINFIYYF